MTTSATFGTTQTRMLHYILTLCSIHLLNVTELEYPYIDETFFSSKNIELQLSSTKK